MLRHFILTEYLGVCLFVHVFVMWTCG